MNEWYGRPFGPTDIEETIGSGSARGPLDALATHGRAVGKDTPDLFNEQVELA